MKKFGIGFLAILLLIITACAIPKKAGKKNKKNTSAISYLKMHRTSCFGRCPTYFIEIYENGTIRFTGLRFVQDTGIYEKNITVSKAQIFLKEAEKYQVDTLKDSYELMIADLPSINYQFNIKGKTKQVRNAQYGPNFLKTMAKTIDELIGDFNEYPVLDKTWKQVSKTTKDQ